MLVCTECRCFLVLSIFYFFCSFSPSPVYRPFLFSLRFNPPSANDFDFYFDHSFRDRLFFFSVLFVLLDVSCSVELICILCIYVCRKTLHCYISSRPIKRLEKRNSSNVTPPRRFLCWICMTVVVGGVSVQEVCSFRNEDECLILHKKKQKHRPRLELARKCMRLVPRKQGWAIPTEKSTKI